jgi:hypothetical protein
MLSAEGYMKQSVLCFLAACLFLLSAAMPSEAGQVEAKTSTRTSPKPNSMHIIIVRSNTPGCEPNCAEWISAEGEIRQGTPALLRRVLKAAGTRKLPIFITSQGGDVDAGYAMGRLIREKQLEVSVSRTVLDACDANDKKCTDTMVRGRRGRATSNWSYCNSSCVFVLAGGAARHVYFLSQVGVHQFSTTRTYYRWRRVTRHEKSVKQVISSRSSKIKTPKTAYDRAAKYFRDMGIDSQINVLIQSAPNDNIYVLSRTDLRSTGIMTDSQGADAEVKSIELALAAIDGPATRNAVPYANIAAGLFKGDAVISRLELSADPDGWNVNARITPRTGSQVLPTADLVASIRVGDMPPNVSAPVATPTSEMAARIGAADFCALQLRGNLTFDIRSKANPGFTGETVKVPTARFKDIAVLFHKVCDN